MRPRTLLGPANTDDAPPSPVSEKGTTLFPKTELSGESNTHQHELSTDGDKTGTLEIIEVANPERPVHEMLGDVLASQEAAGRQLSEKETMMVREKDFNRISLLHPKRHYPDLLLLYR